jgi:hypothetical protein
VLDTRPSHPHPRRPSTPAKTQALASSCAATKMGWFRPPQLDTARLLPHAIPQDCNIFAGPLACKALPDSSSYVKQCPGADRKVDCAFFKSVQENIFDTPVDNMQKYLSHRSGAPPVDACPACFDKLQALVSSSAGGMSTCHGRAVVSCGRRLAVASLRHPAPAGPPSRRSGARWPRPSAAPSRCTHAWRCCRGSRPWSRPTTAAPASWRCGPGGCGCPGHG